MLEEKKNSVRSPNIVNFNEIQFIDPHYSEPIVQNCIGAQFRSVIIPGVGHLKCHSEADNCVYLRDMSVIIISNFVKCAAINVNVVVGRKFTIQQDFYTYPCLSSVIKEYFVSSLSGCFQVWDVNDIECKAVRLPNSDEVDSFVTFSLQRQ